MIDLTNTEIAFAGRSDEELNRAYWLFKLVGNPSLVSFGSVATNLALGLHLPIKGLIRKTVFKQFCGGETIAGCNAAIQRLADSGIGTLLDYSSEGKRSTDAFDTGMKEIISTIENASGDDRIPFAVFKITGIGRLSLLKKKSNNSKLRPAEVEEFERIRVRVDKICSASVQHDVPVFIDAEESWIQDTIDELAYEMMLAYNQEKCYVYNTVQHYRHDRLAFLEKEIERAKAAGIKAGFKLVRGAYMEKERERAKSKGYPSPIHSDKTAVDADYNEGLALCLDNRPTVSLIAGTHNDHSTIHLTELMAKRGIASNDKQVYFSQLYGMSDHISYNLAAKGFNVVKYLPYGPIEDVVPYLIRRAEENTSVAGQTSRELSLIQEELDRRKKS
jgi:proline dehydrogenase